MATEVQTNETKQFAEWQKLVLPLLLLHIELGRRSVARDVDRSPKDDRETLGRIAVRGHNIDSIIYADYTVLIADSILWLLVLHT